MRNVGHVSQSWSEPLLFIFKRQNELRKSQTGADVTLSDIRVTGS